MKTILEAGTLIKLSGIPVSLCSQVEVEISEGNAGLIWGGSRKIACSGRSLAGGPLGYLRDKKPVVIVNELLEVISKFFGVSIDSLKAPIRLQDAGGIKLGEFIVERLVVALLIGCIITPIAWFDGHAKSAWLKQTRGIDIPWTQATFLDVKINDTDANVRMK